MKITPQRSTERITDEFLPSQAEQEWITKFRPRNADLLLVHIARSCCDGFRPTDDEAQCCLNVLARPINERDWKAEVLAVWILGFTKPNFVFAEWAQQSVVKLAFSAEPFHKRTFHQLHRTGRFVVRSTVFGGALFMPLLFQWVLGHFSFSDILIGIIFGALMGAIAGICLTPVFLPISMWNHNLEKREIQQAALHNLRRWNNPRLLGTVAHASLEADAATIGQVHTTFALLLTQLTPDYYGAMSVGNTDDLCRALETNEEFFESKAVTSHVLFTLNLLRALELTGSGQAAKYVRAMINADHHQEVSELAKRVLPILTEREQEETARTTLLRHSALPAPADELLRAASASSSTEDAAETLMRPVL